MRVKPDVCGPDGVSGHTYGVSFFLGTSAATPHVAGAAALVLSKNPSYSVAELWSFLTSLAIDMGSGGQDNIYGHGRLNLAPSAGGGGGGGGGGSGGGSGGCFIATASFGSSMSEEVIILKNFRDNVLLKNSLGRNLVKFYYEISPSIANYIGEHEILKTAVRLTLTPIIYVVKYPKTFILMFLFTIISISLIFRRRKLKRF